MTRAEKVERWQVLLRQQSGSGLSAAAFCREHNVGIKRFYWWKRRLRGAGPGSSAAAQRGFVELAPPRWLAAAGSGVSIRLDERTSIQVERDFDAVTLKAVLTAVREGAGR
jgi:hypothetical protein